MDDIFVGHEYIIQKISRILNSAFFIWLFVKYGGGKNKGKVSHTNVAWFNIRRENDDRRGSFKADLNIGVENQRFGITLNGVYDTKGKNVRGGTGFRMIY